MEYEQRGRVMYDVFLRLGRINDTTTFGWNQWHGQSSVKHPSPTGLKRASLPSPEVCRLATRTLLSRSRSRSRCQKLRGPM